MKFARKLCFVILFFVTGEKILSQNKKLIDSLMERIRIAKHDTIKIDRLLDLGLTLKEKDPVAARSTMNEALRLCNKINNKGRLSVVYSDIAITCDIKGDLDSSIFFHHQAIDLMERMNNERALQKVYSNISFSWMHKKDLDSAEFYMKESMAICKRLKMDKEFNSCLANLGKIKLEGNQFGEAVKIMLEAGTLMEKNRDSSSLGPLYMSVGVAYFTQKNYPKAVQYWGLALQIKSAMHGSPFELAQLHMNLAAAYEEDHQRAKAREQMDKALAIAITFKQKAFMADVYNNLGLLYDRDKNTDSSLKYLQLSIKIKEEIGGDKRRLAQSYINYGGLLGKIGQVDNAITYLEKAQRILEDPQIKNPSLTSLSNMYADLSTSYKEKKDFEKAYFYHVKMTKINDSLMNRENRKMMGELEGKYQNQKKQHEIEQLESDKKVQNAELAHEKTFRYSLIGGLGLVILFSFFLYTRFRIIKKQHRIIELQKKEVELQHQLTHHQKEVIEEKQMEILDSIRYAKRIQLAQIPSEKRVGNMLKKLKKD